MFAHSDGAQSTVVCSFLSSMHMMYVWQKQVKAKIEGGYSRWMLTVIWNFNPFGVLLLQKWAALTIHAASVVMRCKVKIDVLLVCVCVFVCVLPSLC